jgi:hypothetical protein
LQLEDLRQKLSAPSLQTSKAVEALRGPDDNGPKTAALQQQLNTLQEQAKEDKQRLTEAEARAEQLNEQVRPA